MKELKFRLWDKSKKQMLYHTHSDINSFGRGEYEWSPFCFEFDYEPNAEDFILMQFFGQLDINGKEIYQGDLLREGFPSTNDETYIVEFGEAGFDGRYYKYIGFYLKRVRDGEMEDDFNSLFYEGIEIIGNIYENENPGLLESRK